MAISNPNETETKLLKDISVLAKVSEDLGNKKRQTANYLFSSYGNNVKERGFFA